MNELILSEDSTIELNIKVNGKSKKDLCRALSVLQEKIENTEKEIIEINTAGNMLIIGAETETYFIPLWLK
ncbi:hypothetical protein [Helcococcus sueciensis]|uniref:hypothetical protein n=1 Tax=Helcococcus sueciensis TaxID=241555 RepID=UPI00041E88D2|nr:hypothetical protein [Helcococcus sueciensis]